MARSRQKSFQKAEGPSTAIPVSIGSSPGMGAPIAVGDSVLINSVYRRQPAFVLLALLLVWAFSSLIFPLYDTDFWWHLRTGQWIWSEGTVPQVDLYTFTNSGNAWIDLHWGFQLLVAGLYALGGPNAVILFKATILTLAIALAVMGPWQSERAVVIVISFIPAVICISGRGFERPEMLSLLGLGAWLAVLYHSDSRPSLVWLLPLIQVVWVNCHSLFVLGLVVGACATLDFASRVLLGGRWGLRSVTAREWDLFRPRVQAGALCVAAAFINPYFEEGALFPLTVYRKFTVEQPFYSVVVGEFLQPWQFVEGFGWRALGNVYFVAELLVALLALASVCYRWWRGVGVSVFGIALLVGFGHLAWEANRNTSLFALVAASVTAANFVACPERRSHPQSLPNLAKWRGRETIVAVGLCSLIGLVVTGIWNRWGEGNKPFGLGEARDWYIHDAARFAGREGMPEIALVGDFGQAAVYVYHNSPERKVFMDGRLEVCTAATLESLLMILREMAQGRDTWQKRFAEQGLPLPTVLLDTRSSFLAIRGMLGRSDWRLVHADPTAAVFLPVKTAESLRLPAIDARPIRQQLQPQWERADALFRDRRRFSGQ